MLNAIQKTNRVLGWGILKERGEGGEGLLKRKVRGDLSQKMTSLWKMKSLEGTRPVKNGKKEISETRRSTCKGLVVAKNPAASERRQV